MTKSPEDHANDRSGIGSESEFGNGQAVPPLGHSAAALLLFNEAIPLLQKQRATELSLESISQIYCLKWETTVAGGYAMVSPPHEFLPPVKKLLGVDAIAWPEDMSAQTHREVCRDVADRAWQMVHQAPAEIANHPVLRMKINDRVYNRMEPTARIERLLTSAIEDWGLRTIITPWVAHEFDTVERPGIMGMNSPGHRLAAMLARLRRRFGVAVEQLWPEQSKRESRTLFLARSALAVVRTSVLASRAIRDAAIPFPCGKLKPSSGLPKLGFIVGGAAPWYHTKPLVDACRGKFEPVVIAHDIFRNPTTYKLLKKSGAPFVPIDAQLSLGKSLRSLVRGAVRTRQMTKQLDQWRDADVSRGESAAELKADFACLTELELYVDQVRAAIREYDLKAIVSSNILDSLLGAGGEACREEDVPMVCLQNTTAAYIHQPLYADCDLYFAESNAMADFMRESGARGRVEAVGLPIYDDLIHEARRSGKGAIRSCFPELAGKRIVSLIAAPRNHDYRPLMTPLLEMVKKRDDVGLIIRLHPRSEPNQYEQLGRELQAQGKGGRMHHISLASFLADTDYMVATVSSTTQSALVMGVRPFCWVPPEWRMYADEANQLRPEINNRWNDPESVVAALEQALDHPDDDKTWRETWRRFVGRHMTGADGSACERILKRIGQLAA